MGSTFFGLNTALTGLTAQQKALYTTTHNLANASTEGYTRQRVTMAAAPAFANPSANTMLSAGQIGTGVEVKAFARLRDQFIDVQYRQQYAAMGQWDARSDQLGRINQVISEPSDTGLSAALERFWASWHALSIAPESASAREAVRTTADTVTAAFKSLNTQLTQAQTETDAKIADRVSVANSLAAQVNTLNQQIAKVVNLGQQPNDLMDERDRLLDQLGNIALITVTTPSATNGKVSVSIGGQLLVDSTTNAVNALAVDSSGNVTVGGTGVTLTDGSLRGLIDVRYSVIGGTSGYLARLDNLANALVSSVNTQHAAGYALDGTTGNSFFTGSGAAGIALHSGIVGSLNKIAAASTAADVPGGAGNAVLIAQVKNLNQVIGGTTTTVDGYYQSIVSKIGIDADQAFRLQLVQKGVTDATANRRDAVAGVNMDEELSEMVKFQKSYNAAARMMTTIDEMLETIVNRMGIVGR
ncbi:MAG: flagellar hook-associated protein FlgK [Actinomycetota bacterium]